MNHEEARALAQFCADQYYVFDARAWKRRGQYDHQASAMAAMTLSKTDWYGHETELEQIAAEGEARRAPARAFRRIEDSTFDADQFAAMVRAEMAMRRMPASPARPGPEHRSAA